MDIKELRGKLGVTQMELAIRLKVSLATVSRWERDLYRPNKTVKRRLDRLIKRYNRNGGH